MLRTGGSVVPNIYPTFNISQRGERSARLRVSAIALSRGLVVSDERVGGWEGETKRRRIKKVTDPYHNHKSMEGDEIMHVISHHELHAVTAH